MLIDKTGSCLNKAQTHQNFDKWTENKITKTKYGYVGRARSFSVQQMADTATVTGKAYAAVVAARWKFHAIRNKKKNNSWFISSKAILFTLSQTLGGWYRLSADDLCCHVCSVSYERHFKKRFDNFGVRHLLGKWWINRVAADKVEMPMQRWRRDPINNVQTERFWDNPTMKSFIRKLTFSFVLNALIVWHSYRCF